MKNINNKILLFDVDGTLVESSQNISNDMSIVLNSLKNKGYEIGLVGGGKLDKILTQFNHSVYFHHYFSECGSIYNKNLSDNNIDLHQIYCKNIREHHLYDKINLLLKCILQFLSSVPYTITGHFIDLRSAIIYISLIGMCANDEERKYFINLNNQFNYRQNLINLLKNKANELDIINDVDIVEGGNVGIAIYPSEFDKIQILKVINLNKYDEIHYFGDKYNINGNDYNLINHEDVIGHKVNNPSDTLLILQQLLQ